MSLGSHCTERLFAVCQPRNTTSRMASYRNSPLLSRTFAIFFLALFAIRHTEARPKAEAFSRSEYPSIDLRLLDWPQAQKIVKTNSEGLPYTQLECYTELDRSFVDPSILYRVNNTDQLSDRACMLRIPTGTRVTVAKMQVHSAKSYVSVVAGSSQVFMPLRTEHIHADQPERYGPWHVPCRQAYLLFRSKSTRLEWIEFRLSSETEEDRASADSSLCTAEGVNHAQVEFGDDNGHEHEHQQETSR